MDFAQLLDAISHETKLDLKDAGRTEGCTVIFDKNIELTLEHHAGRVYLFSPVMQITQILPENFFSSLLQIHLFGIATHNCSFGYDAGGQRILLFCTLDLDKNTIKHAMERINNMINQAEYWKKNLPIIVKSLQSEHTVSRTIEQRLRGDNK